MCSFVMFQMSEMVRRKGLAEIYRVLKPQGRLLVLNLALPTRPLPRVIARVLLDARLKHDLRELPPLMETSGFSEIEIGQAKFRVPGLSVLSFVRGSARKS